MGEKSEMDFSEYQTAALGFVEFPQDDWLSYLVSGIADECGEVIGVRKKWLRGDFGSDQVSYTARLADEISDVFWYLAAMLDKLGFEMNEFLGFWKPNDFAETVIPHEQEQEIYARLNLAQAQVFLASVSGYISPYHLEKIRVIAECLAKLCGALQLDLEGALARNIEKLTARKAKHGTIKSDAGASHDDI